MQCCITSFVNHSGFRFVLISMVFLLATVAFNEGYAAQVKITFDPSPDTRVVGHKIYYGTSTSFSSAVDLGTAVSCVISNLKEEITYYFAATAYDKNKQESKFSDIVSYKIPKQSSRDNNTDSSNNIDSSQLMEDFENYNIGSNPPDWFDTGANNSMAENDNLFKIYEIDNNKVFGTTSTLVNIHSHHTKAYIENLSSFEYTGRMMMTDPDGGIGVTFLSRYPFSDVYYRLRSTKDYTSFHIAPHPHEDANIHGITDTVVYPDIYEWYRFRIKVKNTGTQTEILAKVWPEYDSEPAQWQIDAYDDSPDRLVSGTFGVWSGHTGKKYWDDLTVVCDEGSELAAATFDADSDGFTYSDDTFRNTREPSYASGKHTLSGGYSNGGLKVTLGGEDNTSRWGMSGGWSRSFNLPSETVVSISFFYKMMHVADSDECGEVLVAVDGVSLVNHVERVCGQGSSKTIDTGWKRADFEMTLSEGSHTVTIGGYLNKKTYFNEFSEIYFDDVVIATEAVISEKETEFSDGIDNDGLTDCDDPDCADDSCCSNSSSFLQAFFGSGSDGFWYADDTFRGTSEPSYATGAYTASGGYNGGGLEVTLGNVDKTNQTGMSGGWSRSFNLPTETTVSISFFYRMIHTADSDECGEVLVSVDDVLLGNHVERVCGVGTSRSIDTGWKQAEFQLTLPEGSHKVTVGGYMNKKTYYNELTKIYFDEISIGTLESSR